MANWIKAIYFVVILAWVIYALSDDAVKYKTFPRRFGLSVALTVIIGLAGFALWHAAVPTSIKLLSEDSEVAESHSLASLKTGSHLDGKAARNILAEGKRILSNTEGTAGHAGTVAATVA